MIGTIIAVIVTSFLLLIGYLYIKEKQTLSKLPPAWRHTPLLGNNELFTGDFSQIPYRIETACKLLGTRSFTLRQFGTYFIVICDGAFLKRLVVEKGAFTSGRLKMPSFSWHSKRFSDQRGIIIADGQPWNYHRKLAMTSLREFGYGSSKLEQKIIKEAELICESLLEHSQGKAITAFPFIATATTNIIGDLSYGHTFTHDDPVFIKLLKDVEEMFECGLQPSFLHLLPYFWMTKIPFLSDKKFSHQHQCYENILDFVNNEVEEKKAGLESERNDILSIFLNSPGPNGEKMEPMSLALLFTDLLVAGTDTSAATLSWAVKVLALHPEMQQQLYEELKDLNMSSISLQDLTAKQLHYTNAFMHECLRYGCIVPQLVPHRVEKEFTIDQYTFPKDAIIMGNVWSIHRDPKVWKFPDDFNPDNFLDEATREFVRPDEFMAFGQGPRGCMGEKLARSEVFILLATIVVNCKLEKPSDEVWNLAESYGSITRKPKAYKVIVNHR